LQEDVSKIAAQGGNRPSVPRKKVALPPQGGEMAKKLVQQRGFTIRLACSVVSITGLEGVHDSE
jgi:hypothetical protein